MTIDEHIELVQQMARDKPEWTFYFVGGCVRDAQLGVRSKDIDVEVFGDYTEDELVAFCRRYGKTRPDVGKSFQALKLYAGSGHPIDILQPRRDVKTGTGHRGFETVRDPMMPAWEAAERRDYAINAMMQDALSGRVYDFFGGKQDLQYKRLHHVSEKFFDDPLRVLRGMQFCARFDLIAERDTVEGCRSCADDYHDLSKERVWDEFYKLFKAPKPSRGLVFLNRSGWIKHFPALAALRRLPQDAYHHPEGTVWVHTKSTADAAAEIARREELSIEDTVVLVAAAILHDVGKADTTETVDGRIVTRRHAEYGAAASVEFLKSIMAPEYVVNGVRELVREHMFIVGSFGDRAVRRLAARLETTSIKMLSLLMEADVRGRDDRVPKAERLATIRKFVQLSESLDVTDSAPAPILMGRHLIEMGYKPGTMFGVVLRDVYEKQLDGEVIDIAGARAVAIDKFSAYGAAYGTAYKR